MNLEKFGQSSAENLEDEGISEKVADLQRVYDLGGKAEGDTQGS